MCRTIMLFFFMATEQVLCLSFPRESSGPGQHRSLQRNAFFDVLIAHRTIQQLSTSKLSFCHTAVC